MGIIKNSITFGSGFNITAEGPIDSRMVVKYISDLTTVWNSDAPAYEGMSVSVLEDGNIYVLRNKDFSNFSNWKKQGSDGGSGIGKYSLPVMTDEMKDAALEDPNSGFKSDSSYISIDDGSSLNGQTTSNNITAVNGTYLYIMMNTIRSLQAEVSKLKNTFQYGIHSYNNEVTARSSMLDQYDETLMDEPLWALDPSMMSEVFDTADFKTELLPDNFTISSTIGEGSINASVPEQLTFINGIGKFSDKADTLLNITDSKLVTYLVTNSKHVYFNLHTKDDINHTRRVDISSFIDGDYNKYGIMLVLSRKVDNYGKNYIYVSVMNYETNEKIVEGYLMPNANILSFATEGSTVYEVAYKYSINSIEFSNQTLYRMKFYTKYEDFSEDVIPSAPDDDYTYKAAHLTIRSVRDSAMMERIKSQLHENELIWNEDKKELNIKSNNKIYKIGIVGSNDNNTNTEETMTPKELIEKLTQMGIIVNAQFDSDNNIVNVDDLKLNDISEFSLINSDTEKKYTFTVDPHGKLIGRDESMKTIEVDLAKVFDGRTYEEKVAVMNSFLDVVDDDNSGEEYGWVRGFIPLYLNSLKGSNKWAPNGTSTGTAGDYGLLSDRLRISSFYAPLKTDIVHGCSHSFIELENTSDVDIPLEGIYLHFYKPAIDGDVDSDIVYHLALDGVIKSGSTYLVRGAQHAEMDDESTFIKVNTYDKEWYYKKKDVNGNVVDYGLVSFEQDVVATLDGGKVEDTVNNKVHGAYKFCLTYGLSDLHKDKELIISNGNDKLYITSQGKLVNSNYNADTKMEFKKSDFPSIIKNRRYIDGCGFSSFSGFASPGTYDTGYTRGSNDTSPCKGKWFCGGVTITENTMFRHMFALDPAKQAYNGWTTKDGSRTRYNKASDLQVVSLNKEYIGFPNSKEIVPINRYTPKASYENKNVMTDKSQLDREKPNMVTCSFGMDVYKTRCFNWISCGAFDEYLWVRKQGEENWKSFSSYTKKNTPMKNSDPNVDFGDMGNVDTFGYVGTLQNINVNGDLNLIDTISTYIRSNAGGNYNSYKNTPVWCRLLKYIDNEWKIVYQSEESKKIIDYEYTQLHSKRILSNEWNSVNVSDIPDDIKTMLNDLPGFGQTNNGLDDNDIKSYTIPVECNKGYLKLTFNYISGSHRINCVGVDVLKNDNVINSDYHVGFTGNAAEKNDYIIYIPENGTYNVRFFAEQDREPLDSVCDLNVAYNVDINPMLKFKMSVKDDANKYIGSDDIIAIVYVSDENAQAISSVRLGFKSINVNGGLMEALTNNSSGTIWSPAFVIGHTPMMVKGDSENICRKEFIDSVNNAVYTRITSRFPGNNVLFTSHKVVIDLPQIEDDKPVVYEYVVGRADKDGNPDPNHTNEIYTFTLYPSSYEGRTYQITDQQGFHWIEYQVWSATAEKLNKVIKEECDEINGDGISRKVFPILINTGDMTQSGARINEWLDYYNGGKCLFNHMEQMNCVGNNDLCNLDPTILGTGNDPGKSNAKFFHYFYCYDIPNDERLIVKAHDVDVNTSTITTTKISIPEDRYIPSIYYFETRGVIYVVANSEITRTTCEKWFGLYGKTVNGETKSINLYTGIEICADGDYNNVCQDDNRVFYPIYETIYSWLNNNRNGNNKKIVFACHEIPFTVITQASLSNSDRATMGYTRNYPNGSSSLLGSHMNQLDSTENRGIYWLTRLLEYFGCKLCIGGHKHTYALSYPIKENYQWKQIGEDGVYPNDSIDSLNRCKPMSETLEDECGSSPVNLISWVVKANKEDGNQYNISTSFDDDVDISSTKLPYIPNGLYESIGKNKFQGNTYYYRCCTPVDIQNNEKYDGFVNYSMCQATGYKLKSNKELPCAYQVFSKLIPMTKNEVSIGDDGSIEFKDTVNGNQLYPMFSVIEFEEDVNGNINATNVRMCRVTGIFKADGKDSFTQTSYGTKSPSIQYLIGVNSNNVNEIVSAINSLKQNPKDHITISNKDYMYGIWVSKDVYRDQRLSGINKYLYIQY